MVPFGRHLTVSIASMAGPAPLVLPIGQYFGTFHPTSDGAQRVHGVRIGGEIRELGEDPFTVWSLAHGVPGRLDAGPWTTGALLAAAGSAGAGDVVAGLLAEGLLAEVTPGTAGSVEFARRHRLGHRMLGLGNTPDEPWLYSIGLFGQPVIRVSRDVYNLWEACDLAESVWAAVEWMAEPDGPDGPEDL